MKMIFTALLTLTLACISQSLAASDACPLANCPDQRAAPAGDNCDLPAPGQFRVVNLGPSSVSLSWQAVPRAQAYEVKAFESGTQNLVAFTTVTTTQASLPLASGMKVDISVGGIAENCAPSRNVSWLHFIGVIIVDLIADRQQTNPNISELTTESCFDVPWSGAESYWFDVYKGNPANFNRYEISSNTQGATCGPDLRIWGVPNNTGEPNQEEESWTELFKTRPYAYLNAEWHQAPFCGGTTIRIKEMESAGPKDLYDVHLSFKETGQLEVCFSSLLPLGQSQVYGIKFYAAGGSNDLGGSTTDTDTANPKLSLATVISPFHDQLTVLLAPGAASPVRAQVFDLHGQLLIQASLPPAERFSLPANQLSAGMYVLRLTVDGVGQTFKVIKT
ncbi:MAG: T9SS type A sorting domain-containing protein [Saprospiraceae bacterium]|nr:T9SS type A sorting domain-containing protein [Saprospiraceae bacterium]